MYDLFTGQEETKKVDNVLIIFNHWKATMNHPSAKLDDKRKRTITKALMLYPVEFLIRSINGCARSTFHMGRNPSGIKYDGICLILRNAEMIEKFEAMMPKVKNTEQQKMKMFKPEEPVEKSPMPEHLKKWAKTRCFS